MRSGRFRLRSWLIAAILALGAIAAAAAIVSGHGSSASYAPFHRCPLGDPATDICLYTRANGGRLTIGRTTVPLSRSITLQGGLHVVKNARREVVGDRFIAARGGTISSTRQPIPGGLAVTVDPALLPGELRRAYAAAIAHGTNGVTATIELAGSTSAIWVNVQNLVEGRGIALSLPVKVRLTGALLGERCYIGSNAHPVQLALTTGKTNPPHPGKPIEGEVSQASFSDDYNLTVIRHTSLVNNSFAAPGATGCGPAQSAPLAQSAHPVRSAHLAQSAPSAQSAHSAQSAQSAQSAPLVLSAPPAQSAHSAQSAQVDRAVDAEIGLPARAGENVAVLDGVLQDANASAVSRSLG